MAANEHRGALIATTGSVVALVGTFLPWLRSGSRNRSSYTIFELADRLGFAPSGAEAWSLRLWPLVPLLLAVAAIFAWVRPADVRWRSVGMVVTALVVVWVGATSLAVVFAPDIALFRLGIGPVVTGSGVFVLAIGAVLSSRRAAPGPAAVVSPRGSDVSGAS